MERWSLYSCFVLDEGNTRFSVADVRTCALHRVEGTFEEKDIFSYRSLDICQDLCGAGNHVCPGGMPPFEPLWPPVAQKQ